MEVNVQIDQSSGMILIALGNMRAALTPQDTMRLASVLCAVSAVHPQLQSKPEPQIVIAGNLPNFDGGIRFNGR